MGLWRRAEWSENKTGVENDHQRLPSALMSYSLRLMDGIPVKSPPISRNSSLDGERIVFNHSSSTVTAAQQESGIQRC